MKLFTQEPQWIIGIGVVVVVVLGICMMKTGAKWLLPAIGGSLALIVGLLVLERVVVTEEEQLEQAMDALVRALEGGDVETVLSHIRPNATDVRNQAHDVLQRYTLNLITITKIRDLRVDTDRQPPEAHMQFNVRANITVKSTGHEHKAFAGVVLRFAKENDRWQVTDYKRLSHDEMFKTPGGD